MTHTHRKWRACRWPRWRLFWQLLATFAILIVFAVASTSALNNASFRQIAGRGFQRSLEQTQRALAATLADYYVAHGNSWAGVEDRLDTLLHAGWSLPGPSPDYILFDGAGVPIAAVGQRAKAPHMSPAPGAPILVDGVRVGTLVLLPWFESPGFSRPESIGQAAPLPTIPSAPSAELDPRAEVTRQVGRSFGASAFWIGLLTLGLAALVSRRVSAPLGRITRAAQRVAAGDLRVEVPGSSIKEVDTLADAFNRMARSLLHADQLRRNMTADIAHELRTPLTIIKGKLEGILDGVYPGTPEHIAPVLEEAMLLERLIEDLRLLSLAEAGQLPLHRDILDVRELLETVQGSFAREAARQNIALVVDVAPNPPSLDADPQRMQQVLGNLLANSLRYTPAGGTITLRASSGPGKTRISVSDTGAGIPPDELPHIFDRFWRGDRARARHGSGAGLGLAIARQLVEAHGGAISATSAPGQGATITIELPAVSNLVVGV